LTIEKLIHELSKHQPQTRVVVQGYEDGFDDISKVVSLVVEKNPNDAWYYGRLIKSDDDGEAAVLLMGSPRSASGRSDDR
jgi:hypothetical protein